MKTYKKISLAAVLLMVFQAAFGWSAWWDLELKNTTVYPAYITVEYNGCKYDYAPNIQPGKTAVVKAKGCFVRYMQGALVTPGDGRLSVQRWTASGGGRRDFKADIVQNSDGTYGFKIY